MGRESVSWRELISSTMRGSNDGWENLVYSTLSEEELDVKFDSGWGGAEGLPFTLWTKDWVYFPVVYDGSEWCGSVPRNPCDTATEHQGGE